MTNPRCALGQVDLGGSSSHAPPTNTGKVQEPFSKKSTLERQDMKGPSRGVVDLPGGPVCNGLSCDTIS